MDVLFILHADHEQNCGTTAMRVVGSSHADPYSACAAAAAALYGPLHGGANEAVVRMLDRDRLASTTCPAFIEEVKSGKGSRLMGFGHRVYKNYDPRATIIKQTAYDVFEVTGKNPLLDIALKLEEVALSDDYFISRKLYPNVDFYSGLIYQAMGFPVDDVHRAVRHPPHRRLAGPLAGAARRQGPEDQPAPPGVRRPRRARLRRPRRRPRLSAVSRTTSIRILPTLALVSMTRWASAICVERVAGVDHRPERAGRRTAAAPRATKRWVSAIFSSIGRARSTVPISCTRLVSSSPRLTVVAPPPISPTWTMRPFDRARLQVAVDVVAADRRRGPRRRPAAGDGRATSATKSCGA